MTDASLTHWTRSVGVGSIRSCTVFCPISSSDTADADGQRHASTSESVHALRGRDVRATSFSIAARSSADGFACPDCVQDERLDRTAVPVLDQVSQKLLLSAVLGMARAVDLRSDRIVTLDESLVGHDLHRLDC